MLGLDALMISLHDDVIKWKHFPRYWPFVRGNHRSPVNYPHKGQWRGALMFSLICVWINGWVNNREAGDLRRYRAHYDVIVMNEDAISYPCSKLYDGLPTLLIKVALTLHVYYIPIRNWLSQTGDIRFSYRAHYEVTVMFIGLGNGLSDANESLFQRLWIWLSNHNICWLNISCLGSHWHVFIEQKMEARRCFLMIVEHQKWK